MSDVTLKYRVITGMYQEKHTMIIHTLTAWAYLLIYCLCANLTLFSLIFNFRSKKNFWGLKLWSGTYGEGCEVNCFWISWLKTPAIFSWCNDHTKIWPVSTRYDAIHESDSPDGKHMLPSSKTCNLTTITILFESTIVYGWGSGCDLSYFDHNIIVIVSSINTYFLEFLYTTVSRVNS